MIMRKSFSSIYLNCPKQPLFKDICEPVFKLSTVSGDFEGRSVQQTEYVVDDPRTRYNGLKPSDFSLENQIAVGVPQKLAQYSPSFSSIDSEIERVNKMDSSNFKNDEK